MATITNPVPGTAMSQGVLAGDTQTLAIGTSAANGTTIAYNARWQWNLTGAESTANAGSNLQLQNIADDGKTIIGTPISINRASGVVTINTGSSIEFGDGTVSAPSIAPASNAGSGLYFTTNAVDVAANGVQAAQFATATTGVNYLKFTPAATTVAPSITAAGSDTDVGLTISGKGAGQLSLGNATSNILAGPGTALATTATVGHLLIPTCAGTPTGVPVGHAIGNAAIILDTSGNKLWLYDNGTWKGVVVA